MPQIEPRIHPSVFVAEGAVIRGDVEIGAESSIWFGVVIRGDVDVVRIGERTNVQDGVIIHVSKGFPVHIGNNVTIGHGAVVHGATVEDGALIAIRATVLDGAHIGAGAMVGAGALVPPGMHVPPGTLALGVPARIVGPLDDAKKAYLKQTVEAYIRHAREYREGKW